MRHFRPVTIASANSFLDYSNYALAKKEMIDFLLIITMPARPIRLWYQCHADRETLSGIHYNLGGREHF